MTRLGFWIWVFVGIWDLGFGISAAEPLKLTVQPEKVDRRSVLVEYGADTYQVSDPPFRLREQTTGVEVPCQWEVRDSSTIIRWQIPFLAAGESSRYVMDHAGSPAGSGAGVVRKENGEGSASIVVHGREVTRYHDAQKEIDQFWKPYFYPLLGPGDVHMTRGFPMETRPGEDQDHPHHVSVYLGHGDVNGKDFWSRQVPIHPASPATFESGTVVGRLWTENAWSIGESVVLREKRIVEFPNFSPEVMMDWTIYLTAGADTVTFGKTKEGSFAIRVAQGLTEKAGAVMVDSEGRHGEKEIWSKAAKWVDYSGTVEGKKVGISIMNHPDSFRFPTTWHARGYGLFAANPFMNEAHTMKKGESLTLKYRVYVHSGNADEGKVAEVYNGYAIPARVTVEK